MPQNRQWGILKSSSFNQDIYGPLSFFEFQEGKQNSLLEIIFRKR